MPNLPNGPKGNPRWDIDDDSDFPIDLTALSDWAARVIDRSVPNMDALGTLTDVLPGCRVHVESVGTIVRWNGTIWVPVAGEGCRFRLHRDKNPSFNHNEVTILESAFTWAGSPIMKGGFQYNNGIVTVPFTGAYRLDASFHFADNPNGPRYVFITRNGGNVYTAGLLLGAATGLGVPSCSGVVELNAGDQLRMYVQQVSGGPLGTPNVAAAHSAAGSFFSGHYLGS